MKCNELTRKLMR